MLTKQQSDKLRGYVSRFGETSKAYGKGLSAQLSDDEWKVVVAKHKKASNALHKHITECTEKAALEPESSNNQLKEGHGHD